MFVIRYTDLVTDRVTLLEEPTLKGAKYVFGYAKKVATRHMLIELMINGQVTGTHTVESVA